MLDPSVQGRMIPTATVLKVRLATKPTPSGGLQVLVQSDDDWQPLFDIAFEDAQTTTILGFNENNQGIYMLNSRDDRDTAVLVHMKLTDQSITTIANSDREGSY